MAIDPPFPWVVYARLFMPWDGCGANRADLSNAVAVFAVYAPLVHSAAAFVIALVLTNLCHTMILAALTLDMLLTYAFGAVFSSFLVRHAECMMDVQRVVPHEVGLAATGAVFYALYELRLSGAKPRAWVLVALGAYAVIVPWAMIHLVSFTLPQVCAAFALGTFSGAVTHVIHGWVLMRHALRAANAPRTKTGGRPTTFDRFRFAA